jgi:hypothetical protein
MIFRSTLRNFKLTTLLQTKTTTPIDLLPKELQIHLFSKKVQIS